MKYIWFKLKILLKPSLRQKIKYVISLGLYCFITPSQPTLNFLLISKILVMMAVVSVILAFYTDMHMSSHWGHVGQHFPSKRILRKPNMIVPECMLGYLLFKHIQSTKLKRLICFFLFVSFFFSFFDLLLNLERGGRRGVDIVLIVIVLLNQKTHTHAYTYTHTHSLSLALCMCNLLLLFFVFVQLMMKQLVHCPMDWMVDTEVNIVRKWRNRNVLKSGCARKAVWKWLKIF